MQQRHPTPSTVFLYLVADAILFKWHNFNQHSVSTINSTLVFNGNISQVRKGDSWIKMHPGFNESLPYMTGKQQQCLSNIWEFAPENNFLISYNMGSSDMVVSWCLNQHSPWVICICHLMPFNHGKYLLKLYQSDMVFFHIWQCI